eukprot:4532711-Prymnesium_polylepis.1
MYESHVHPTIGFSRSEHCSTRKVAGLVPGLIGQLVQVVVLLPHKVERFAGVCREVDLTRSWVVKVDDDYHRATMNDADGRARDDDALRTRSRKSVGTSPQATKFRTNTKNGRQERHGK